MKRARLTETVLRQAIAEWLNGKSWRALGSQFQVHPKWLAGAAKRLGFMAPDTLRQCPKCQLPRLLSEFTRAGAAGKILVLHECNACERAAQQQRQPVARHWLAEELDALRVQSLIHVEGHLARVRARTEMMALSKAQMDLLERRA